MRVVWCGASPLAKVHDEGIHGDLAGAGDGLWWQDGIHMGRFGVRRQVISSSSFSAREYSIGEVFVTPSTVVDRRTVRRHRSVFFDFFKGVGSYLMKALGVPR
jgi:hypothetical protein